MAAGASWSDAGTAGAPPAHAAWTRRAGSATWRPGLAGVGVVDVLAGAPTFAIGPAGDAAAFWYPSASSAGAEVSAVA